MLHADLVEVKDVTVESGVDDRSETCVYIKADLVSSDGRVFRGPIACLSSYRLAEIGSPENWLYLDHASLLKLGKAIAKLINESS